MHVTFVYLISLHPKKAIDLLFWDKQHILYEKSKNIEIATYTIRKLGPLRSF